MTTMVSDMVESLLLVVGDIDKGDAHLLLDALEFDLHILTQLEIQRTQQARPAGVPGGG